MKIFGMFSAIGLLILSANTYADSLDNLDPDLDNDVILQCVVKSNSKVVFNDYCIYRPTINGVYLLNTDEEEEMFGGITTLFLFKNEEHSKNQVGVNALFLEDSAFSGDYTISKNNACLVKNNKEICLYGDINYRLW